MQDYPDTHPNDLDRANARFLRALGAALMAEAGELQQIADEQKPQSLEAAETYLEVGLIVAHIGSGCNKAADALEAD